MALRSLVVKLRTLLLRARGPDTLPPKLSQRSTELLDPAKFASVKDYIVAIEKEMRRDLQEFQRLKKANDRAALAAHGVGAAAAVYCGWSVIDFIVEDEE